RVTSLLYPAIRHGCITGKSADGTGVKPNWLPAPFPGHGSTSNNITEETIMAYRAKRNSDRCPTHPGALLREDVIPATGKTKAEIAQLLGISRQHLHDVL